MKKIKSHQRSWQDEDGLPREFHYFLIVEEEKLDSITLEHYGVAIEGDNGETSLLRHITVNQSRVEGLLETLYQSAVSPLHLEDVVADWL